MWMLTCPTSIPTISWIARVTFCWTLRPTSRIFTSCLRTRCKLAKTTFPSVSIRTPSPAPRLKRRFTPPEIGASLLTPGTLNAESRAIVVSPSGETVVLLCVSSIHYSLHHCHTAIYTKDLAGDIRGFISCKKSSGISDLFRLAFACERDHFHCSFKGFGCHGVEDLGVYKARRNRVHRNIARSDFTCQCFCEGDLPAFGCRIIRLPCITHLAGDRCHINHAPCAFSHHVFDGSFRAVECAF